MINSLGAFFSRLTGVLKQNVSNFLFGAGQDPFLMAFRFVNSFWRYVGDGGALTSAFIPSFQKKLHAGGDASGKKEAFRFASNVMNIFFLINLAIVVLGMLLAPLYAPLLVPGYKKGSPQLTQNIFLTMIMMPYLIFISFYAMIMGILNSHKKFTASAFAPVVSNLAFMVIPLLFYKNLGIYSLGIAVIAGAVFMVLTQLFELRQIGFKYSFVLDFKDKNLKEFFKLYFPTAVNMIVVTVKYYANSIFLSLYLGSAMIYMNAFLIIQAPLGIVGTAIGSVMMPLLSRFHAEGDMEKFNRSIIEGFYMILYLMIPFAFFFIVFPDTVANTVFRDITKLLTGNTGKFTDEFLRQTYTAVRIYALALLPMGCALILDKIFYSLHDAGTPLRANIIIFVMSFGLYFSSFLPGIAFYGVFAADMIASWMMLLYYVFKLKKSGKINIKNSGLFTKTAVLIVLSLIACGAVYPLHRFIYLGVQNALPALCIAALEFALFGTFYYILTRIFRMDLKR